MCHRRGSGAPTPPFRRRPRYETIEIAMAVARIAMEVKCFEDVVVAMESVAMLSLDVLTAHQMHMLGLGYRKVMEAKRRQWRRLENHRLREARRRRRGRGLSSVAMWIRDFIHKIERDMENICMDAKFIIGENIYYSSSVEIVFYHKLLGDLYNNSCLYKSGNDLVERATASLNEYERADAFAADLHGNSSLRLSFAVDFSALCHKMFDLSQRARDIIKTALGAVTEETLDECSMLLVNTLKDKLQKLGPDEENGEDVDGGHI